MSTEEFCDIKMTEKEEWESHFNGKRCSIEALDSIIIKKRGNGPEKPIYTHTSTDPGPYYDPRGNHIHIWKGKKNIKNLNGEQNQNVKFIQFTYAKPGYYCSICHARNKNSSIKWVHSFEKTWRYHKPHIGDYFEDFGFFMVDTSTSNAILSFSALFGMIAYFIFGSALIIV